MGQEVLIIGAGIAGAACSLRLAEHGIKSIILEARNRIGGRIETVKLAENVYIDFGASNVHGYGQPGNPAQRLAEKLGIELNVTKPEPGMVFNAQKEQIPHERVSELQKEIQRIMAHQEHTGEADISLGARAVHELQSISPEAEGLARMAEVGAGIRLENISAKYWKTEKGFAGVDALPSGGYSDLVKKIIEASEAKVILEQEVVSIEEASGEVKVSTNNGQSYSSSHTIITVPIAVLQTGSIAFDPSLPADRLEAISRTSIGLLDKFSILYTHAWWPKNAANFIFLPSQTQNVSSTSTPLDVLESCTIMVANMYALATTKPPVLLLYLPPHAAEVLEEVSNSDFTPIAHQYVAARLQSVSSEAPSEPVSGRMVRWKADPYSLGATTSPIALGKDARPDDLSRLGEPLWDGRLGFAGEGTDRHLRGSVPGAVASGEREADRLVKLLK